MSLQVAMKRHRPRRMLHAGSLVDACTKALKVSLPVRQRPEMMLPGQHSASLHDMAVSTSSHSVLHIVSLAFKEGVDYKKHLNTDVRFALLPLVPSGVHC